MIRYEPPPVNWDPVLIALFVLVLVYLAKGALQ